MKRIPKRFSFVLALVVVLVALTGSAVSASSTTKTCNQTAPNVYTCTFTISPSFASAPGDSWLVKMVSPGPGTLTGTPTVATASGCGSTPTIQTPGSFISSPFGNADYNVAIGAGCTATAVVTITEIVTVTASGQICQNVWINAGSPFVTSCATVVFTPPTATPTVTATPTLTPTATATPKPTPGASAVKNCTVTATPNLYTCLYTVTPGFPAASIPPSGSGDYIHVNEAPGPPMTGPGIFTSTPAVVSVNGCSAVVSPVVLTSPTSYNAWVGATGCAGTTWSVTFSETVAVTASGQICQSFWMVAAVPPVTTCATVVYVPPAPVTGPAGVKGCSLTATPNLYTCLYTVTPGFPAASIPPSGGGDYIHVNESPGPPMTGPGFFTSTPLVVSVTGCGAVVAPVVLSSSTSYNAWVGPSGCPGTTWSVTFSETIAVNASGQICQSFWMVAAVPPVTTCATVVYVPQAPAPPAPGTITGQVPLSGGFGLIVFSGGLLPQLVTATGCPTATMALWTIVNGSFVIYVPGTSNGAVNAAFLAAFPGGVIPPGTALIVRCI